MATKTKTLDAVRFIVRYSAIDDCWVVMDTLGRVLGTVTAPDRSKVLDVVARSLLYGHYAAVARDFSGMWWGEDFTLLYVPF